MTYNNSLHASHPSLGISFALRLARRELRGDSRGLLIFFISLTFGISVIAGVGSLSSGFQAGLRQNAQIFLGGDIEVRVAGRGLEESEQHYLKENSMAIASLREMRSIAYAAEGQARTLVELKGVPPNYPIIGSVELNPPLALHEALAERNGRWGSVVDNEVLSRLGIDLGETIAVGNELFEIRAVIFRESDRVASAFNLGPRLMVSADGFSATGLVREGSLIRYLYRIRIGDSTSIENWLSALHDKFPNNGWSIRDVRDSQPTISRFIDQFRVFIIFIGMAALLVGGIGIGYAVQSYLVGRTSTIATLKCLGVPSNHIFGVYLIEIAYLCTLGVALGLIIGALAPLLTDQILSDTLPVPLVVDLYLGPLLLGGLFGFLVAAIFILWPLGRASSVSPTVLFRRTADPGIHHLRGTYALAMGVTFIILVLTAIFGSGAPHIALWFIPAAITTLLVFRGAATVLIYCARNLGHSSAVSIRIAVSNICRPGAPTSGIVVSLGAGLSILVGIALTDGNLSLQVRDRILDKGPSFFFIDIQPDQALEFDAIVHDVPGSHGLERVPMLRGRITLINGIPADDAVVEKDAAWVLQNEIGITYSRDMPSKTHLVSGSWWVESYEGSPLISLDSNIAHGMNVGIGDSLTFNILGRPITAVIYNLRRVDWMDIGINFVVVTSPGILEKFPQTHLATVRTTLEGEDVLFRTVTDRFPNISPIRVRDVVDSISNMLERIAMGVRVISSVVLVTGILVLGGALAAGYQRRVYDSVLLKVLGATRGMIFRAYLLEFLFLGLATGLIASAIGTLSSWVIVTQVMLSEWTFLPSIIAGTILFGILVTLALGFFGTWRALSRKALPELGAE